MSEPTSEGRTGRLRAAVEQHWVSQSGDVPTSVPGCPLDATRRPEWVELWLAEESDAASRRPVKASTLTVTAHVFARESADARTAEWLVDRVRDTFAGQTLDAGGGLCLRLHEAEVRDLTRERSEESPALLRHLVVLVAGRAELLPVS